MGTGMYTRCPDTGWVCLVAKRGVCGPRNKAGEEVVMVGLYMQAGRDECTQF